MICYEPFDEMKAPHSISRCVDNSFGWSNIDEN